MRKIAGLLLLFPTWYYAYNTIIPDELIIKNLIVRPILTVMALGLSYSLLHKKDYPVQLIITILISDFILYKLKTEDYYRTVEWIYYTNLYLGTALVLAGKYGTRFFRFILSPIQNFLRSIGIKVSIPIIAGILVIPIGFAGLEFLDWLAEYRRLQRIENR